MKKSIRVLIVVLMLAAFLTSFVACKTNVTATEEAVVEQPDEAVTESTSEEAAVETAPAVEPITVKTSGHMGVTVGLPLYLGEVRGVFSDLGLDVERVHYLSGPPQLEAMPSGAWDIAWIGVTAANTGVLSYNCEVVGVAGIDNTQQIFVREDSAIYQAGKGNLADYPDVYGTPDTWKGATILCEKGTLHYLNVSLLLEKFGLTEDDVNIVHMDVASAYQAFLAGEGDVFASFGSATLQAINAGFKVAETMNDIGAGLPALIITSPGYAEANRDTLVKYLKGAVMLQQFINDAGNKEYCAQQFKTFYAEESGTELSDADALTNIGTASWMSVDQMRALGEMDANGVSGLEKLYSDILDKYISLGMLEAEKKDALLDAVDVSYLAEAMDSY